MRALTLHQPSDAARAYLAGVIRGDGWLTSELALRCADQDFARAFAGAIRVAFGGTVAARLDERGYWIVRSRNTTGRYDEIRGFEPAGDAEIGMWLRGMFDSEGNARFARVPGGPQCYARRIAFYSTDVETMALTSRYLSRLGLHSRLSAQTPSASHMGTKPVFELHLAMSRRSVIDFATKVGSNIARKCGAMFAMAISYQNVGEHARRAQAIGVANRRARAACAL